MRSFCCVVVLLFSFEGFSQANDLKTTDSSIKKNWNLQTSFEFPDYRFLLATGEGRSDLNVSSQRLQFNPSNDPEIAVSLSRNLFSLGYRTSIPFIENSAYRDFERVKTKVDHFEFGWRGKIFEFGSYYSRFKGYYVDLNATTGFTVETENNNTTIITGEQGDGVPDIWNRPDIETYNYGFFGQAHLPILGKNSLFSGLQENVDGINQIWEMGYFMGLGYHRLAIEGDSPFVPNTRSSIFPEIAELTGIYQHVMYLKLGLNNKINITPRWHAIWNVGGGWEGINHYERNARTNDRHRGRGGRRIDLALGFGYGSEQHNLSLLYRTSFRLMEISEQSSLDSQFSHTGLQYNFTF